MGLEGGGEGEGEGEADGELRRSEGVMCLPWADRRATDPMVTFDRGWVTSLGEPPLLALSCSATAFILEAEEPQGKVPGGG